jgi:DNA-binding NarL/FixJ family response regulator
MNGETGRLRVLIADDHRMFREALRLVLEPECEVVAQASGGEEAVALALKLRPDVVVMDVGMQGAGGIEAARRLAKRAPATKVLILSQYDDEEYVLESLAEARAAGYVLKGDAAADLLSAVRAVCAGKRYISPSVAPIVLRRVRAKADGGAKSATLTRRERAILKLIGEGATAKEIAARLGISPKTAQVHRANLMAKLNTRSTAGLVRWAIKHKIIRLE